MTDPTRPTDEELTGRIRRSMDHYRLEAPLPSSVELRPRPAWRAGTLLAAGLAGALLTLAVLGAFNTLRFGPQVGSGSPTPEPSGDRSVLPGGSPVPHSSPTAAAIPEPLAAERCLTEDGIIPDDWMQNGEDAEQVRAHFRRLPLLIEERREFGSLFVYGDEQFVAVCTFEPSIGDVPDYSGLHVLRETLIDSALGTGSAFSSGGTIDAQGNQDPADPANLLLQGWASAEVSRVEVVLDDGGTVPAYLADGVWVAWWQRASGSVAVRAYGVDGSLVAEVPHELTVPQPIGPDGVVVDPGESAEPSS